MLSLHLFAMQKQCLNDNCYNITKQLSKKLEFLSHSNRYLEDAKKEKNSKAEETWKTIQTDERKHAEMLRDLLVLDVKNNKF